MGQAMARSPRKSNRRSPTFEHSLPMRPPPPQAVVDAVSAVLAMPPSTRLLRIPIATSGIEEINDVCAEMQMADGRAVGPHCAATTSP